MSARTGSCLDERQVLITIRADSNSCITYADGAATIDLGEDGKIVLDGVDGDDERLQASNFVFIP